MTQTGLVRERHSEKSMKCDVAVVGFVVWMHLSMYVSAWSSCSAPCQCESCLSLLLSRLLQNPQADLQAQDRCHRIGQTKPVVVYRFVTANTIDQQVVEKACSKRKLEQMVIHKGETASQLLRLGSTLLQLFLLFSPPVLLLCRAV